MDICAAGTTCTRAYTLVHVRCHSRLHVYTKLRVLHLNEATPATVECPTRSYHTITNPKTVGLQPPQTPIPSVCSADIICGSFTNEVAEYSFVLMIGVAPDAKNAVPAASTIRSTDEDSLENFLEEVSPSVASSSL